jgi:subtilisin family serine protease
MLFCCTNAAVADELKKGKLGYGFEPGLVAGKDYVAGQLIVGMKKGMSIQGIMDSAPALGAVTVKKMKGAVLLEFPSEQAVKDAVRVLIRRPDVVFVERNGFMSVPPKPELPDRDGLRKNSPDRGDMTNFSVSTDPGTGYQWHHTVIRKTAPLPALSTTPPTVAVLDTGVDYTHPDLSDRVILGKNSVANTFDPYDDYGHGTHVAGIIAAKADNGQYGEGVCPNCKILAVKVLNSEGWGTFFDIADGMAYARTAVTSPPTKVLNMSLGGSSNSTLIANEVAAIKDAGKVLVASAGNGNDSVDPSYPGGDKNTALRVMATEQNDCRAYFSNFSPSSNPTLYNIAAPGWLIPSTTPGAGYASMSGTSMASPVVAGAAALAWGQLPSLSRDNLVARMVVYGKTISCGFAASTKRVDVRKAIYGTTETALIGRFLDPFSGKPTSSPIVPANARLYEGTTQLAADGTNSGGFYEMSGLSAGTRRFIKGDKTGYVNTSLRAGLSIIAGIVQGPYTDAFPRARGAGTCTFTLDWKNSQPIYKDTDGLADTQNGWDFDLMIKLPSGSYIYPSSGDLMGSPYVFSPRDSFYDLEPLETIVIGPSAANGVYKLFVDKYTWASYFNPSWTNSLASVQMFTGASSVVFYTGPPSTCGTYEYWYVGDLTKNGNTYTFASKNTCTDTMP